VKFSFNSYDGRRSRKTTNERGVKPRSGPFRKAVLYRDGWWRLFPGVLEALEFAHANTLVGAKVRCIGDKYPCAEIVAFDWKELFNVNRNIPIGFAPMPAYASGHGDSPV
jgi:hypothetical protein